MKQIIRIMLIAGSLLVSTAGFSQLISRTMPKGSIQLGMFDGRTPCQELSIQLKEPKTPECNKIKWRLFLYKDSVTGRPTAFELYGLFQPRMEPKTGSWHIIR